MTVYLYGVDGKKLGAYTVSITGNPNNQAMQLTPQSYNVYFAGMLIVAQGNTVATDRLGSVRWGGPNGLGYQAQFPYGQEYTTTANDREKYATYTRDSISGLDYAVNRYYFSQWGRFLSPDPSTGSIVLTSPQSWNRYAYMLGDPSNGNDPSGLDAICGPSGWWSGEGCYTYGADASAPPVVNPYAVYNSQGQQVNTGSMLGNWSTDLTSAFNDYAMWVDSVFLTNASNLGQPDAACVQSAIGAQAAQAGLTLAAFAGSAQVLGTPDQLTGGLFSETELDLTGTSAALGTLIGQMCTAGFSSNGQCPANNMGWVGSPHSISWGPYAGQNFTGNFRSSSLFGSVQVNTYVGTNGIGYVQIDVDPYNPAAAIPIGAILHGVLQVLPNTMAGTDNGYGCQQVYGSQQ